MKLATTAIVVAFAIACDPYQMAVTQDTFCGESFCLSDLNISSVLTIDPVGDYLHHVIDLPVGRVNIYEDNFPDIQGLAQTPAPELPHLTAWDLTPTEQPTILILVGAKWPHYLVVNIERSDSGREELIDLLKHLTLNARADE